MSHDHLHPEEELEKADILENILGNFLTIISKILQAIFTAVRCILALIFTVLCLFSSLGFLVYEIIAWVLVILYSAIDPPDSRVIIKKIKSGIAFLCNFILLYDIWQWAFGKSKNEHLIFNYENYFNKFEVKPFFKMALMFFTPAIGLILFIILMPLIVIILLNGVVSVGAILYVIAICLISMVVYNVYRSDAR